MSQQSNYKKNNNKKNKTPKPVNKEKLMKKVLKLIGKMENNNKTKESMLKVNQDTCKKLHDLVDAMNKTTESGNYGDVFKQIKKDHKQETRNIKQKAKQLRKMNKEKSKVKRELKKKEKESKFLQLEASRISELPLFSDNKDIKVMNLIIDGWNICGCDKIARKSMRGKRGSGAKRIIELLQLFRTSNYCKLNGNNNINIIIHFDGNGKDLTIKNDNIIVKYSGKEEIVDDRLVREFGYNVKNINLTNKDNIIPYKLKNNPNNSYFVVTSDRELTLRLNKVGVTCMKSGTFYKTYIKELAYGSSDEEGKNNNNNNNDSKDNSRKNKGTSNGKPVWKKYVNKSFSDDSSSSSDDLMSSDDDEL